MTTATLGFARMLDSVFPVVSNSKVRWNGSDSAKKTPRYPWVFVGARAEEHRLVGCEQSLTLSLTATSKLASVVMRQASMTTFAPLAQAATRDHPCASLSQPTNARVCPNQQYRDRRRVYQRRFSPKEGRRTINSAIAAPQASCDRPCSTVHTATMLELADKVDRST